MTEQLQNETVLEESSDISELAKALCAAQAEMPNAKMDSTNPHFKSKFASLAAVKDASLPTLTKHGLCITQLPRLRGGAFVLYTKLMHSSGQWIAGEFPLPDAADKPQTIGSALTYAKRYSWSGATGVVAEEDDDGQAAQDSKPKPAKKAPAPPAEAPEGGATPGKDAPPPDAAVDLSALRMTWYGAGKQHLSDEEMLAYVVQKYGEGKGTKDLTAAQLKSDIETFNGLKGPALAKFKLQLSPQTQGAPA